MASVHDIDPTEATKIADAIKAAVKTNPGFAPAHAAAAAASTVDHSGGSREGNSKPTDLAGVVTAKYRA